MSGLVDLQVNGYGGVDFNAEAMTGEWLHDACAMMRRDGVELALATIITDDLERMVGKLRRLVTLRSSDSLVASVICGLHVEGPFISAADGYRGAHPADAVRVADVEGAQRLYEAADGLLRIVTLAPECDPGAAVTGWLADRGVIVSAGHTDASGDDLDRAIDHGLSMVTHLGNGCPVSLARHDNIIQRVLARADRLRIGFIADGVHVPGFALRNYLAAAGAERCFVVSDASAPAGMGPGRYTLGRLELDVGDDLTIRLPGTGQLAGSARPLRDAAGLLSREVGLDDATVRWLTCDHPRAMLGL